MPVCPSGQWAIDAAIAVPEVQTVDARLVLPPDEEPEDDEEPRDFAASIARFFGGIARPTSDLIIG